MLNAAQQQTSEELTFTNLTPKLGFATPEYVKFCRSVVENIRDVELERQLPILEKIRSQIFSNDPLADDNLALLFAKSLVLDLVAQGWRLKVLESEVYAAPPIIEAERKEIAKQIIRNSHLIGRDAQLKERSVQEFIKGMERRRYTSKGWFSIHSLMRDGRDLSEKLREIARITNEDEKIIALSKVVSPYLQFVESDSLCEITGLRLGDIWRYFRHTWVNEYKSVPGRLVMVLVRDAAAPNHPVIGIAALGSSVVQHGERDKWIGWHKDKILEILLEEPKSKVIDWLHKSLEYLIADVYIKDLLEEEIIASVDLINPTVEVIQSLKNKAELAIKEHRKFPHRTIHSGQKSEKNKDWFWEEEAKTSLYRSKRCSQLSKLLNIRRIFQTERFTRKTRQNLSELFENIKIKNAVVQLVRMIKAQHVGIDMMDITVCGAIAPYNSLLGGKLVCMLLCSPELNQHYNKRYSEQTSIIASGMKGKAVTRKPNLVLLCTTSLYNVGSSQYNRVKIPLREIGVESEKSVFYDNLGDSYGYGTYHFSRYTTKISGILNSRKTEGRLVNSIFGEGVNPLMRKLRESLNLIGLDSKILLTHGNTRITYGISLAENFRNILLGAEQAPKYLLPQKNAKKITKKISEYWITRWLSSRIRQTQVLDDVERHSLSYPIKHGAAVALPPDEKNLENLTLFD